jgi:hypothetical protein
MSLSARDLSQQGERRGSGVAIRVARTPIVILFVAGATAHACFGVGWSSVPSRTFASHHAEARAGLHSSARGAARRHQRCPELVCELHAGGRSLVDTAVILHLAS